MDGMAEEFVGVGAVIIPIAVTRVLLSRIFRGEGSLQLAGSESDAGGS